jgi:hypothetical protein
VTCRNCAATVVDDHCLGRSTGSPREASAWLLTREPETLLRVISATLGQGELTEAGWSRAINLAALLWDGHLVALAWIQSLGEAAPD